MAAAAMQPAGPGFPGGGPLPSGRHPPPPDASLDALCARFLSAPRANAWLLASAPVAPATALAHASAPVERLASPAGASLVALGPDPASGLTLAALLTPGAETARAAMAPSEGGGAQLVSAVFSEEGGAAATGRLIRFGTLKSAGVGAGLSKSIDWFAAGMLPPADVPASPLPPLHGVNMTQVQNVGMPGGPTPLDVAMPGVSGAMAAAANVMMGTPMVTSGMEKPELCVPTDEAARSAAMSRLSQVMSAPPPVTMPSGFVAPPVSFPVHTAPPAHAKLGVLPAFHAPQPGHPAQSISFSTAQSVPVQSTPFPAQQTGLNAQVQAAATTPTIPSIPGLPPITAPAVSNDRALSSFAMAEQLTDLLGGMGEPQSQSQSQSQIDAALALAFTSESVHAQPLPPALGAIPASAIFSSVPTTRAGALSGGLPAPSPPTALSGGQCSAFPDALQGAHPGVLDSGLTDRLPVGRPAGSSGAAPAASPSSTPGAAPTVKKRAPSAALVCQECGVVIRGKRGNLNRHIAARHLRTRAFSCSMPSCGLAFQSRLNLERHMTRVHEGRAHRCPRCPRRFRTASALARHTGAAHGPRRAFVCTKCGAFYGRRSVLDAHTLRVHPNDGANTAASAGAAGAGPAAQTPGFECALPGCAARFGNWPAKRDHEAAAHGGCVHPCPTCDRVLESEEALSRHLRTDHAATQSSRRCPVCGGVYSQRANLLRHISLAHKDFVWDGESGFPP